MGDSYQNYFTALPSSIPTLPCPDVPLPVAHTQQAVVVSNEDPKKVRPRPSQDELADRPDANLVDTGAHS